MAATSRARLRVWAFALLVTYASNRPASAQLLPEQPITFAGGHVVLGAEVTATVAPEDPGFFNYTSYEYNALRNFRVGMSAELKATDRIQVLGEVRLDHGTVFDAYGLFLRLRPWPQRRFDIQIGRIPPTFGAMSRSAYGSSNMLIGQPLAYQYLMSIRPDALPANADDLLRMRGRGWLSDFPVGNTSPAPGLPLVSTAKWDTGIQTHGIVGMLELTGSITAGSLSDPRFRDNNDGRQWAGRLVARPVPALALGVSGSRGGWLNHVVDENRVSAEQTESAQQTAVGFDGEFSAGPVLVRGEVIRSSWSMPVIDAPAIDSPLVANSVLVEGRYRVGPGFYVALRAELLGFSTINGSTTTDTWEADTSRLEAGVGYSVIRNLMLKGSWQLNDREGGRVRRDALVAAQVLYWF